MDVHNENEMDAPATNNEIENLLNESSSVIQKIKNDFPLVLNNESGADLLTLKSKSHATRSLKDSKSAGRMPKDFTLNRFNRRERPFTMTKADK
jgi:hypothetical protein